MRNSIRKKLIDRAFDHREKELKDRRPIIAKMAYEEIVTPEEQKRMAALPPEWFPSGKRVEIEDHADDDYRGYQREWIHWDMTWAEPYPYDRILKIGAKKMSDDLLQAVEEQVAAEIELGETKAAAVASTQALLDSYNWVEDLVTGWPEAASVIHEVVTTGGVMRDLPAVTSLNSLLGLPPGQVRHEHHNA
jgi:hypothetical protein